MSTTGMIDLHSHILYALDDGARTREEALEMGRLAAADGVSIIAATPHSPASAGSRHYDVALIRDRLAELNAAFQSERTPIKVISGTEITYAAGILDQLQRGALLTYGESHTILLEFASNTIPYGVEVALFNIQIAGYRIVLAHPERLIEVQHNPDRLIPLIERGVLMQITAEALTGAQGTRLRHTAEALLTHAMVHVIASDTHGIPPRRPPILSHAYARATALVGPATADALVVATPHAILNDQPLTLPPARPVKR